MIPVFLPSSLLQQPPSPKLYPCIGDLIKQITEPMASTTTHSLVVVHICFRADRRLTTLFPPTGTPDLKQDCQGHQLLPEARGVTQTNPHGQAQEATATVA